MSAPATLDLMQLTTQPKGTKSPEWWGIMGLVVIEAVVFTGAMASYYHFKILNAQWPPLGIDAPDLLLPTLNTVLLTLSIIPAWWAVRGMRRGDERPVRIGYPIGLAMLVAFLGLKVYEQMHTPYSIDTHAYASAVMLMTYLHMAHVAAVAIKTGVILRYVHARRVDTHRSAPVTANAVYWYFVAGIWIPLYTTIYLSPRFLP
jgi:cytochrome c oxidase subunit III